jgi:hypothetical protein
MNFIVRLVKGRDGRKFKQRRGLEMMVRIMPRRGEGNVNFGLAAVGEGG